MEMVLYRYVDVERAIQKVMAHVLVSCVFQVRRLNVSENFTKKLLTV
jgi:hypothetical protein